MIYISAIWGKSADGRGIANYRVWESGTREEAEDYVRSNCRALMSDGYYFVKTYVQPDTKDGVSSCRVSVYRHADGRERETGYWSQPEGGSESNPGHCEAAYLGRE